MRSPPSATPESEEIRPDDEYQGVGTILVADDEPGVRALTESVLNEAGYTVELVEDGSQAVERLRALGERVSLVLLDLTMPLLSGAEAARELRRAVPNIPIVAMSGYGDLEVMEQFSGAQIDDYLPKPFGPEQLLTKVKGVLSRGMSESDSVRG